MAAIVWDLRQILTLPRANGSLRPYSLLVFVRRVASRKGTAMTKKWILALPLAALVLCAPAPLAAQVTTGTIVGTVSDASGVVPGATITVREVNKGTTNSYVTDATGNYTASFLVPGTYAVEVNVQGFKKSIREGIILQVNQRARIDITLEIGRIEETTTVVSSAPLVRADSSEVGTVIEERAIKELPLNGRNFATLVYLTPGITPGQAGENLSGASTFNPRGASNFNALGHQANANAWLIDGIDNNEYLVQHGHHLAVGRAGARVQGADRGLLGGVRPRRGRHLGLDQVRHQHVPRNRVRVPAGRRLRRAELLRAQSGAGRREPDRRSEAAARPQPVRRGRRRSDHQEPDLLLRRLRGSPGEAWPGVRQHGADRAHADGRLQRLPQPGRRPDSHLRPAHHQAQPGVRLDASGERHQPAVPARSVSRQCDPGGAHQRRRPQRRRHLPAAQWPRQLRQLHVDGQPRDDR